MPKIEAHITCPECQSELKVEVDKKRVNPPEPAEYSISANVSTVKQGELFKNLKKKSKATKVEKPKEKVAAPAPVKQIGNAVPVELARALVREILR